MPHFHHVNLGVPVGGQHSEEIFLVDLLGYRRVSPGPELEGFVRWLEGEDGAQVHLSEDPEHRAAARAHVAIDLGQDLPAIEAKLVSQGVKCDALEDRGVRLVFCQDPAGNRWELRGSVPC